jgi:hypothetical protein
MLRAQLSQIQQHLLFMIFLDLKKACNTVDRERMLVILEKHGVGPAPASGTVTQHLVLASCSSAPASTSVRNWLAL